MQNSFAEFGALCLNALGVTVSWQRPIPLSSLLREEVDAFEACVRDIERLLGIGA